MRASVAKRGQSVFFYMILRDRDRCRSENIAGVDQRQVSKQRGLRRLVTSWLWLVPVPGCLLWSQMNRSCLMCHFQARRASGSQAECGGRAGGVSSLYLALIRPPLCDNSVCSSKEDRSAPSLDWSRVPVATVRPPADCQTFVWYFRGFWDIKICSGLIRCCWCGLIWYPNQLRWASDALWIISQGQWVKMCFTSSWVYCIRDETLNWIPGFYWD